MSTTLNPLHIRGSRANGEENGTYRAVANLQDPVALSQAEVAVRGVLEVAAPLAALNFVKGTRVEFYVAAFHENHCEDRVPREGLLTMIEPTTDFELQMGQA